MKLLNHLDDELELPNGVKFAYGERDSSVPWGGRVHWYTSTQTAGTPAKVKIKDLIEGMLALDAYIKNLIEARENAAKLIDEHLAKIPD